MNRIPLRAKVIRYVCEQGLVSVEDVHSHFQGQRSIDTFRVMMYQIGLTRLKYNKAKHGVWCVQEPRLLDCVHRYFPELPRFLIREKSYYQIAHCLGLNLIRRNYEQTDKLKIVDWWSEELIRALPAKRRQDIDLRWCPDAVFWRLRKGKVAQKVFIEYERTYKNIRRYSMILGAYEKRKDIAPKSVLYICENEKVLKPLVRAYQKLLERGQLRKDDLFQFTTIKDINNIRIHSQSKGGSQNENY